MQFKPLTLENARAIDRARPLTAIDLCVGLLLALIAVPILTLSLAGKYVMYSLRGLVRGLMVVVHEFAKARREIHEAR